MNKKLTGFVAALVMGGTMVGAASPAEAYWRGGYGGPRWGGGGYGYRHYGYGNGAGLAIGAGILGLGLGAAIAADRRPAYYGYAPPPPYGGYYAPPPPPSYYYQQDCRADYRWDGYAGRYVPVPSCR